MKKIFAIIICSMALLLTSCAFKTEVSDGIGIPSTVSSIKFYNGGACIFDSEGKQAQVAQHIQTNTKIMGNDISFYVYEVTCDGKTCYIMDSEALTAVWY